MEHNDFEARKTSHQHFQKKLPIHTFRLIDKNTENDLRLKPIYGTHKNLLRRDMPNIVEQF